MGAFKKGFYTFLKTEIDGYDSKISKNEPFLYTYLREKKEADPRLVILKCYRKYLENGKSEPQAVVSKALGMLGGNITSGIKQVLNIMVQTGEFGSESEAAKSLSDAREMDRFLENANPKLFTPELCRTLVDDVRASFPYNEKRNDRYVRLRERDLLFMCDESADRREYFLYLLDFSISAKSVTEEIFSLFVSVWERICRAVPSLSPSQIPEGGKTRDMFLKRLVSLRTLADTAIPDEAISRDTLHKLAEKIMESLIKKDAKDWLYDAGFPSGGERETKNSSKSPRKADHTMELIDSFLEGRGREFGEWGEMFAGSSQSAFDFEKSKRDIAKLFEILDKDKSRRKVLIPLTVDSATGAGIYIVGSDHLKETKKFSEYLNEHNCCYNVIYPLDYDASDKEERKILYMMNADEEQIYEDKLEEAYSYYSVIIDPTNEDDGVYYFYQGFNKMPPKNCPKSYLKYFEGDFFDEDIALELDRTTKFKPGQKSASSTYQI